MAWQGTKPASPDPTPKYFQPLLHTYTTTFANTHTSTPFPTHYDSIR
jgi:hypothetical protein